MAILITFNNNFKYLVLKELPLNWIFNDADIFDGSLRYEQL